MMRISSGSWSLIVGMLNYTYILMQRHRHHMRRGAHPKRSHTQICLCDSVEDERASPASCLQVIRRCSNLIGTHFLSFSPKIKLDTENISSKDSDIPEWKLQPKLSYDDDEDN